MRKNLIILALLVANLALVVLQSKSRALYRDVVREAEKAQDIARRYQAVEQEYETLCNKQWILITDMRMQIAALASTNSASSKQP